MLYDISPLLFVVSPFSKKTPVSIGNDIQQIIIFCKGILSPLQLLIFLVEDLFQEIRLACFYLNNVMVQRRSV